MLGAARHRLKARVAADQFPEVRPPDALRVAAVVRLAQAKLKKYAELPPGATIWATSKILDENDRMGSLEGVGVHLQVASIALEADGSVSPDELARFLAEGDKAMEKLESAELNNMVLIALYLTMFVSMVVLHAGALAYVTPEPAVFGELEDHGLWADLATFAWPDDAEARQALRRALYVAERVILSAGVMVSLNALSNAQYLFISYGVGLPSLVAKYEYFFSSGTANMMKRMKVRPQAEPGTFRCCSAAVAGVCSAALRAPLLMVPCPLDRLPGLLSSLLSSLFPLLLPSPSPLP